MTGHRRRVAPDAGFTLVELLMAMAVMMIVMGATLAAFTHVLRVNEVATLTINMNDHLRTGMDLMTRDFIQVGNGLPTGKVVTIPSGAGAAPINRPGPPAAGALTFDPNATEFNAVIPGPAVVPVSPNTAGVATDLVTVFYADSMFDPVACALSADGSTMTLTANTPIENGDLIMFTNSLGSAIQAATARQGLPNQQVTFAAGDPMNLNQRAAAQGTVMQLQSGPGTYPPTTAARVRMVTYYIDPVDPPRLVRHVNFVTNQQRQTVVAFGIENLQLSYDLVMPCATPPCPITATNVELTAQDLAGGGGCGVAPCSPNQIRKINLFLGARSRNRFTVTNRFVRHTLASQVSLRSLSFVDRYQ